MKRRGEITALMDKLDTEKKTIEQKLKVFMGDAEIAENEKYRVSWKSNITNRLDSKALKQDYPDIYRKYEKTTNCRRFLVKDVVA